MCRVPLGRDPLASGSLRFDRQLSALCRTVFPRDGDAALLAAEEARADEARRRRDANAPRGRGAPLRAPPEPRRRAAPQQPAAAARLPPSSVPYTALPSVEAAVIIYELLPLHASGVPPLDKPFVRTPPNITAAALQRYISARLPSGCAAAGRGVRLCGVGGDVANEEAPLAALITAAAAEGDAGEGGLPRVRYCLADA